MIRIDISILVFFYVLLSVVVILAVWIVSGYRGARTFTPKDIEYIWKCRICSNVYIDSKHEDISSCPLCGSYNKRHKEVLK